jgi:chromosome segregation ATPase
MHAKNEKSDLAVRLNELEAQVAQYHLANQNSSHTLHESDLGIQELNSSLGESCAQTESLTAHLETAMANSSTMQDAISHLTAQNTLHESQKQEWMNRATHFESKLTKQEHDYCVSYQKALAHSSAKHQANIDRHA